MRQHIASRVVARGWWLGLVALIAYCATASPYIVDGDNAEFVTLGAIGGRGHPSGYPLYVVWVRLWSWLPGAPGGRAARGLSSVGGAAAGCHGDGGGLWRRADRGALSRRGRGLRAQQPGRCSGSVARRRAWAGSRCVAGGGA